MASISGSCFNRLGIRQVIAVLRSSSLLFQHIGRGFHHRIVHHAMAQIRHDFWAGNAEHHLLPPFLKAGKEKASTRGDRADAATRTQ